MQHRKHLLFMRKKARESRFFAVNLGVFPIFRVFQQPG